MSDTVAMNRFRLAVPDGTLDDLHNRLRRTRWPQTYRSKPWAEGTEEGYLRDLCAYWANGYDWRAREAEINRLPQFVTKLGGRDLHFVHVKSPHPGAAPLLITHGWPGSFLEMRDLVPLLTDPADPQDAFNVVVPSIPGYGLSEAPAAPGTSPEAIGSIFVSMMERLGYSRFFAQGGDFGATISCWIARRHADRLTGLHLNLLPGTLRPSRDDIDRQPLTTAEQRFVAASAQFAEDGSGYMHMHRTRPQTLAYGLTDSPVALASWIIEKFFAWSDCNGNLEQVIPRNLLLDNLTLYWVTNTIASSLRLYREHALAPLLLNQGEKITTPTGYAVFPREISLPPREMLQRSFSDLRRYTEMPRGGHFAAMEQPNALAAEIKAFFRPLRAALL
ncbi:pimeloyl-ACP methyl ester carboxylesterase [Rhizobium aquaticum]|uniref:Pimeloyl-ACP methyl ester carboxylesterase n=1 Tax=Rhizobium aquaticum TaxID=1549636 RepID=A0ABV2J666_9HYPH